MILWMFVFQKPYFGPARYTQWTLPTAHHGTCNVLFLSSPKVPLRDWALREHSNQASWTGWRSIRKSIVHLRICRYCTAIKRYFLGNANILAPQTGLQQIISSAKYKSLPYRIWLSRKQAHIQSFRWPRSCPGLNYVSLLSVDGYCCWHGTTFYRLKSEIWIILYFRHTYYDTWTLTGSAYLIDCIHTAHKNSFPTLVVWISNYMI